MIMKAPQNKPLDMNFEEFDMPLDLKGYIKPYTKYSQWKLYEFVKRFSIFSYK